MKDNNNAIAVISFGTTYTENAKKTIQVVVDEVSKNFKDIYIIQAYTSNIVRRNLANKGIDILSPEDCFYSLIEKGFKNVIVLPTHIIGGEEYNKVLNCVEKFKTQFESITVCNPLITEDNISQIVNTIFESIDVDDNQYLVLMGHGSPTEANKIYHLLNEEISNRGVNNIYISTVEATPDVENAISKVRKYNPDEIILAPFMLVAGDHANNDMAIDWKGEFNKIGFKNIKCIMKGLGEYPQFRKIYIDRVREKLC
ncbi:MAG: sirohydrochlorin cobaltochelatase [Oscillospiraceae bacterium]